MRLLRLLALAALASGCETSIYYPRPLGPPDGWVSACDGAVDATVVVQNDGDRTLDLDELLPDSGCAPASRGTVDPGERVELGDAVGRIWRAYDLETRDGVATWALVDGENVLVAP